MGAKKPTPQRGLHQILSAEWDRTCRELVKVREVSGEQEEMNEALQEAYQKRGAEVCGKNVEAQNAYKNHLAIEAFLLELVQVVEAGQGLSPEFLIDDWSKKC